MYNLIMLKTFSHPIFAIASNLLGENAKRRLLEVKNLFFRQIEKLLRLFLLFFGKGLVLTYDPSLKIDGTGAQLQRIFGLYALSKRFNIGFVNTRLRSVAVHPLDSFQSDFEVQDYLNSLARIFHFPETNNRFLYKTDYHCLNLNFRILVFQALKSYLHRKEITIHVVSPFSVIDYCPNSYSVVRKDLLNWSSNSARESLDGIISIVVHYRSGVGGMAVQKGEKFPREINSEYYIDIIDSIILTLGDSVEFKIIVFTDAPPADLEYKPPREQFDLWSNSPRFEAGIMKVLGNDLSKRFAKYGNNCFINVGGNPLEAIEIMSRADYLIMGRSSFSYIAAILNYSGTIYYPSNFWHPPMSEWKISI